MLLVFLGDEAAATATVATSLLIATIATVAAATVSTSLLIAYKLVVVSDLRFS